MSESPEITTGSAAAKEITIQARDLLHRALSQLVLESHTAEGWNLADDISGWLYRATVGDAGFTPSSLHQHHG